MTPPTVHPLRTPIADLTLDQAVAELAEIFDAAPPEEDQLARYHWQQDNTVRARQLEAHIERLAKAAPRPAVTPEPIPAREPEPGPAMEEPPVKDLDLPHITPAKDRMATALGSYQKWLGTVKANPSNRAARGQAQKWASTIRAIAKVARIPKPDLEPLPVLPDPKLHGRHKRDRPELAAGDWIPEPEPALPVLPSPCADDCTHPDHHHAVSTADLDARDRTLSRRAAPEQFAAPCDALETLRRVRRDVWLLLVQLADLPPAERAPYRAGLQAVIVGCESGLDLVDESPVPQAV